MYFYLPLHSLAAAAAASFSSSSKPITVRGGRKRPKPRREKSLSRGGGRPTILYYALLLFPPTPRFFFWLLRRLSFSASSSQSDPSLRKQQQEAQYEEGKQMNQWWNWLAQKEDRDPLYHTYTAAAKEESGAVYFSILPGNKLYLFFAVSAGLFSGTAVSHLWLILIFVRNFQRKRKPKL